MSSDSSYIKCYCENKNGTHPSISCYEGSRFLSSEKCAADERCVGPDQLHEGICWSFRSHLCRKGRFETKTIFFLPVMWIYFIDRGFDLLTKYCLSFVHAGFHEETCHHYNYELRGNDLNDCGETTETPEECQNLCKSKRHCFQFTWVDKTYVGNASYTSCCLKNDIQNTYHYVVGLISGPKQCGKIF